MVATWGRPSSTTSSDVMAANARSLGDEVSPGDLVLLHDPQTAGLAGPLARRGAHVVWRSHIGIDGQNELSRSAWEFLRPLLADAEAYVFTRSILCAGDDSRRPGVDHPALHRSLLAQEPAARSPRRDERRSARWASSPTTRWAGVSLHPPGWFAG